MKMAGCYRLKPRLLLRDGFSLIEVMIAMVVLLVGLLGFLSLQITAIQVNEANKRLIIAKGAATQEIEKTKAVGYTGLRTNTILTTTMLMAGPEEWGYYAGFGSLPANYQFAGIDTSCPFTYCVYKGVTVSKIVGGTAVNYDHTVKLSVVVNYLSYPVLQQCQMTIYWMSRNELKQINFVFFNEYKT
ncbi:MAG: prepilin-type N-terminal cleavage/methylation domain-containing protein [Nitrospirae bacterium]|nr:prepilin-type N-terminal cleavage/methylation domain-containing protein [Nitrospirota bacterium]